MAEKKLTGKIARDRIHLMETPRPPAGLIDGFKSLGDATGIVSDVMDQLGITGAIAASVIKPTIIGACIAGPALTVRNVMQREHVYETARRYVNKMAEFEAHNLALPGDVLVMCSDGLHNSVEGSEMAALTARGADLNAAARRLIELANDRDGNDNISVSIIRVRDVERVGMYRGRPYKLR